MLEHLQRSQKHISPSTTFTHIGRDTSAAGAAWSGQGVVLACDMAAELEPGGPPGDVLACAAATSLSPHRARSKVMESKWRCCV